MFKKRAIISLLFIVMLVSFSSGCSNKPAALQDGKETAEIIQFPITLTDRLGRQVTIEKQPQRIISIAPVNTEILFAVGLGDKVVGVTDHCDYPREATEKKHIGSFSEPNIELILNLQPDLVLASSGVQDEYVKTLENLGVTVFTVGPKSIDDTLKTIELVGQITGQNEAAHKITADMRRKLQSVTDKVKNAKKIEVFWEVWNEPLMTVGPNTFVNSLIELAGGVNIAADAAKDYPEYSLEVLIERNPKVYLAGAHPGIDINKIKERKGYEKISAVKNNRIYLLDSNLVSRPGPRIVDGLEEIAKAIHPELF
ncbi:ABC transporter substrate-binding protein [Desulfolucanica intricata]|uniref:ABC transporter substrate-binding protein n=1 Tax=Desulfolucanica intricata TaxID=1285191 RepID=UPI000832266C|nr:cobalamin-binding protein [Desulfolucanica intricata]